MFYLIVTMPNKSQVEHRFANGEAMAKWCFLNRPDFMREVKND